MTHRQATWLVFRSCPLVFGGNSLNTCGQPLMSCGEAPDHPPDYQFPTTRAVVAGIKPVYYNSNTGEVTTLFQDVYLFWLQ